MFKKIFILIFTLFFVVSCWDDEAITSTTGLIKKETETLSIAIPSNWEVIEDKENILPKAKEWEIELAVASKSIVNWFANNLLILSDNLDTFTSSKDYSMLNNVWASTDYLDYTKLETKDFQFMDEELSIIYIFEAKYNLDTPKIKFLQTARVCNQNKAFFFTIAIPTTIKDTTKYEYLLSTFECK